MAERRRADELSCWTTRGGSATRRRTRAPTSTATTPAPSSSCWPASRSGGICVWRTFRGGRSVPISGADFRYARGSGCTIRQIAMVETQRRRLSCVRRSGAGAARFELRPQHGCQQRRDDLRSVRRREQLQRRRRRRTCDGGGRRLGPAVADAAHARPKARNGWPARSRRRRPVRTTCGSSCTDRPGILASIAAALAGQGINLDAVLQEPGYPEGRAAVRHHRRGVRGSGAPGRARRHRPRSTSTPSRRWRCRCCWATTSGRDIFFDSCHLTADVARLRSGDVRVPASVANLGGGFDTLAVAVQLYLRLRIVEIRDDGVAPADGGEEHAAGQRPKRGRAGIRGASRADRPAGRRRCSSKSRATFRWPPASGSSAAAAVAGLRDVRACDAAAAGRCAAGGGHVARRTRGQRGGGAARRPDVGGRARGRGAGRASMAVAGGTSLGCRDAGDSDCRRRRRGRRCPTRCPRKDAVFNLQRVLSLVHALQSGDYGRLREAVRGPLASAGACGARAAARRRCSRWRIRRSSGRSSRAPGRRWPSSRGVISRASSSCWRRRTNAPVVR